MEKTEAVNKLKRAGYQVQFDSSVVTVLLDKEMNITQEIKKLRTYLKEIGYDASFGVKQTKVDSVSDTENVIKKQEKIENEIKVGEQFSLEDFGIN